MSLKTMSSDLRPAAVERGRGLVRGGGWCPSYEVASALVDETAGICGGRWWMTVLGPD